MEKGLAQAPQPTFSSVSLVSMSQAGYYATMRSLYLRRQQSGWRQLLPCDPFSRCKELGGASQPPSFGPTFLQLCCKCGCGSNVSLRLDP